MEKQEILSHQKIFRQINSIIIHLVKPLLSRKFCQKCVRENSRNVHTVVTQSVENREILGHRKKYFVKSTLQSLALLSRNICQRERISLISTLTPCKLRNFTPAMGFWQKFRQINFLLKSCFTINWFDGKNFRCSEILDFPHSQCKCVEKWKLFSHQKIFCQINSLVIYLVNPVGKSYNPLTLWILQKFTLTHCWQKFRESYAFTYYY